jgi:type II secretory pathway pseudopilin PulG
VSIVALVLLGNWTYSISPAGQKARALEVQTEMDLQIQQQQQAYRAQLQNDLQESAEATRRQQERWKAEDDGRVKMGFPRLYPNLPQVTGSRETRRPSASPTRVSA